MSDTVHDPEGYSKRTGSSILSADLPVLEVQGTNHRVRSANAAFCRLIQKELTEFLDVPLSGMGGHGALVASEIDRLAVQRSHLAPAVNWMSSVWPGLGGNMAETVMIQVNEVAELRQKVLEMNEALLVSGLREHEQRAAAEEANARLIREMAGRTLAESLLREANVRLESAYGIADHANKSKDLFIAALSHELRTPLTPVLVAASRLSEDPDISTVARKQLRMIERNIVLEARLMDDLLDITRIIHGKLLLRPVGCDAHSLIGLALEMIRAEAEQKEITIERLFEAKHGGLFADAARFQQVIWNLLRNAVKFTPQGGKISIRTSDKVGGTQNDWLQIEVSDTGVGIQPEALEKIFEPFDQGTLTSDRRLGGIGLGLTIARSIVVLHGGTINVHSPGASRGSTFVVRLPSTSAPPPSGLSGSTVPLATTLPPVPASSEPDKKLRLLFVEDHLATLEAIKDLLEFDGHHVVGASSVKEALTAAAENSFDFVLSDLGLPDGSGVELMSILRDKYGLQGIALSGYGMEEDIRGSGHAGFVAHLIKPISPRDLRGAVAQLGVLLPPRSI